LLDPCSGECLLFEVEFLLTVALFKVRNDASVYLSFQLIIIIYLLEHVFEYLYNMPQISTFVHYNLYINRA